MTPGIENFKRLHAVPRLVSPWRAPGRLSEGR